MDDKPKTPPQRPQPATTLPATTPTPDTARQALQQSMDRRW